MTVRKLKIIQINIHYYSHILLSISISANSMNTNECICTYVCDFEHAELVFSSKWKRVNNTHAICESTTCSYIWMTKCATVSVVKHLTAYILGIVIMHTFSKWWSPCFRLSWSIKLLNPAIKFHTSEEVCNSFSKQG